ncbi:hypothetical protein H310_12541 [Aphanomyces invadans]|uniref:heme oxygenase (biliverdin-producing) n=1 Tax=Aphanomyces invadans TaxID=157072 RepID=A0A024TJJ1_9STRA|nr:hypothetical protein H310_12541 [Aphanomyces invadans]ETV93497.1 hypothetical protein H310_12541 [Aphanomyces invadans]|eukprot:XP_008877839.1 hypothetical protein H310_12541 [Aphanomyces invadans]
MPPHSLSTAPPPLVAVAPPARGHLAQDLKEGTQAAHAAAESVLFLTDLLRGRIPRDVYRVMVAMLYYVYEELELQLRCAAASEDPVVTSVHFPVELERLPSLAQDLSFYYGSNWKQVMPPKTPATEAYVARLRHLGTTEPALLVAHAYTRYLGDLSGGQILKRHAIRTMDLAHGLGTAFYDFKMIESSYQSFKDSYRSALDAAMVSPHLAKRMVTEANVAFGLNMALFQDLDALRGIVHAAPPTSTTKHNKATSASVGCPFACLVGKRTGETHHATRHERSVVAGLIIVAVALVAAGLLRTSSSS